MTQNQISNQSVAVYGHLKIHLTVYALFLKGFLSFYELPFFGSRREINPNLLYWADQPVYPHSLISAFLFALYTVSYINLLYAKCQYSSWSL